VEFEKRVLKTTHWGPVFIEKRAYLKAKPENIVFKRLNFGVDFETRPPSNTTLIVIV